MVSRSDLMCLTAFQWQPSAMVSSFEVVASWPGSFNHGRTKKLLVVPFNALKWLNLKFIHKKHTMRIFSQTWLLPRPSQPPPPPSKKQVQLKRQEVQVIIQKLVLGGIEFLLKVEMQKKENIWKSVGLHPKKSHYKKYVYMREVMISCNAAMLNLFLVTCWKNKWLVGDESINSCP